MKGLDDILENTLRKANAFLPAALGEEAAFSFSSEDKKQLLSQLRLQVKFHNKLVVAIVVMHFLLFALAVVLAVYNRTRPYVVTTLLGGSVLGLMVIIRSLVNLLKTKGAMDFMLVTLPNLSPKESIKLIQSLYFHRKQ